MKKGFITFLFICLGAFVAQAGSGAKNYWVCDQVGEIEGEVLWVHSPVFHSEEEILEEDFEVAAERQLEGFHPAFGASCEDFSTRSDAMEYMTYRIKQAVKRSIGIRSINFPN